MSNVTPRDGEQSRDVDPKFCFQYWGRGRE